MMKHKLSDKRVRILAHKGISPLWVREARIIGGVVAAIAIIHLAIQGITYLIAGNYYGHTNYWNQPVGTLLIISIFAVLILVGFDSSTRYISKNIRRRQDRLRL